jgi:hypothetical protein
LDSGEPFWNSQTVRTSVVGGVAGDRLERQGDQEEPQEDDRKAVLAESAAHRQRWTAPI